MGNSLWILWPSDRQIEDNEVTAVEDVSGSMNGTRFPDRMTVQQEVDARKDGSMLKGKPIYSENILSSKRKGMPISRLPNFASQIATYATLRCDDKLESLKAEICDAEDWSKGVNMKLFKLYVYTEEKGKITSIFGYLAITRGLDGKLDTAFSRYQPDPKVAPKEPKFFLQRAKVGDTEVHAEGSSPSFLGGDGETIFAALEKEALNHLPPECIESAKMAFAGQGTDNAARVA